MSNSEVSDVKKKQSESFRNWKENPLEIKIMDLASLAWLALVIIDFVFNLLDINWNVRSFPTVFLPAFMFIITISLRLRLVEKPETLRNTFITWAILFILTIIGTILIIVFYPAII
ncbi:MAG: hypothetical protein FK731_14985 [Asgard group archaeon]|nr:hypothetical protein [Asgard group archaeon]